LKPQHGRDDSAAIVRFSVWSAFGEVEVTASAEAKALCQLLCQLAPSQKESAHFAAILHEENK